MRGAAPLTANLLCPPTLGQPSSLTGAPVFQRNSGATVLGRVASGGAPCRPLLSARVHLALGCALCWAAGFSSSSFSSPPVSRAPHGAAFSWVTATALSRPPPAPQEYVTLTPSSDFAPVQVSDTQ